MNRNSSFKTFLIGGVSFFLGGISIELAFCYGVLYLGVPINVARVFMWFSWIVAALFGLHNFAKRDQRSRVQPSNVRKELVYGVLFAFYLTFSVATTHFVVQPYRFSGQSMEPTLYAGDYLIVKRFKLKVRRGDLITFELPPSAILDPDQKGKGTQQPFLKRVVGLPGDQIAIKNKQLFVNGESFPEPYAIHKDSVIYKPVLIKEQQNYQAFWESGRFVHALRNEVGDNFGPIRVPEHNYFVLGDNRDYSFDSRYWGPLPKELLTGIAVRIYSPVSHARNL